MPYQTATPVNRSLGTWLGSKLPRIQRCWSHCPQSTDARTRRRRIRDPRARPTMTERWRPPWQFLHDQIVKAGRRCELNRVPSTYQRNGAVWSVHRVPSQYRCMPARLVSGYQPAGAGLEPRALLIRWKTGARITRNVAGSNMRLRKSTSRSPALKSTTVSIVVAVELNEPVHPRSTAVTLLRMLATASPSIAPSKPKPPPMNWLPCT